MSDNNPYQAPANDLNTNTTAVAPNPNWTIGEVLSEAWHQVSGFKGTYWGALLIYMGIVIVTSGVFGFLGEDSVMMGIISQIVIGLISYPLAAGLMMIAIKRSVGLPTNAFMIFDYYPKTIPIFLLYLLMMVLIVIGLILLILPGIYLAVAYTMALPLLVEKNMGIWEALETSRKSITACWFRFFGLVLIGMIILMVSAIPLGIGLIWTLPFISIAVGIVYRNHFGVA